MFGYPAPECPLCGAFIGDADRHQMFHAALTAVWQKTFGFSDEEAAQMTGTTLAEHRERMTAMAASGNAMMQAFREQRERGGHGTS